MFTSNWIEKNANDYDELISAINNGDVNSLESILNKSSMSGWEANPLYDAVSSKNERIKQMMCDHYRKFDRYSMIVLRKIINDWDSFNAKDKQIYETIIHELTTNNDNINKNNISGSMLAQACQSGNVDIVRVLIKQGANLNFVEKNSKLVPLHLAILRKHSIIVDELARAGASVNMSDKDGNRSLHFASQCGNVSIIKTLLRHGASVDCKNYTLKCTPLHLAVEKGHKDVVEELIKASANLNISNKDGKNALHIASEFGFLEILELLLSNSTDPDSIVTGTQYTSLFLAIEKGHVDVVERLLKAKADVNALAANGKTPLYVGLEFDRRDITNILIDHGADLHCLENDQKSTLLHVAASFDNKFVIEQLIAMGVDVNARDIFGKTPLHQAAISSNRKEAVRVLLSLGADKSLEDYDGRLAFHYAIENQNFEAIDLLFDVEEAKKSQSFRELVDEILKNCHCPSSCQKRINDALDRVLTRLIKFEAMNVKICDNDKLKVHRIKGEKYYNECLAETERLKDFIFGSESLSLYDFLHLMPRRRLAYIERIPSDLTGYKAYGCLIEDYTNDAIERKSLIEIVRKALYELTNVFLPDLCVERMSDFLSVENLNNLSNA